MAERTTIPPRVNVGELRRDIAVRRAADNSHIILPLGTVESMLIEVEAYRNKHDPASKRRRDAVRAERAAKSRQLPRVSEMPDEWRRQPPND